MEQFILLSAIALFNLGTALAFANLYLKNGRANLLFTIALAFVATNIAIAAIGLITGTIISTNLPLLASQAGAALMVVLGMKRMLKGWKTRIEKRFYDITNPKNRFALLMAVNIDTLMLALAAALVFEGHTTIAFSIISSTAILGAIVGTAALKKQQLILSNLIEIVSGSVILIAGALTLFF
jgi:putative Mn2+ efflux pump MntP